MKIYRKSIQGLMLLALIMLASIVHAQSVFDVTSKLGITSKNQGHLFLEENNPLECDTNLYRIINKDQYVVVGALVCNKTANKDGRGDYSTYWKNSNGIINRYTWVFVLENFMQTCKSKNILSTCTSERLCKLLGLGTDVQRDTIVCMKVPKDSLFRPAYVTDISRRVEEKDRGKNTNINQLDKPHREWMVIEQITNKYPWTRMGYTFDWGSTDGDYKGVAEFVIRPKTQYSELEYITIDQIKK